MKTYGEVIGTIRKNKLLLQKEVANNNIARSNLSKIENSTIIPSITTLKGISDSLDITLDELDFIKNNYTLLPKQKLLSDFFNIVSNIDNQKIVQLIIKCKKYLDEHHDLIIKDILCILQAAEMLCNNEITSAQDIIRPVWQRLEKINKFTLIEIKITCNILYLFPNHFITRFTPKLLQMIDSYIPFDKGLLSLKTSLLINTSTLLFQTNPAQAKNFLNESIQLAQEINRYDLLGIAYYIKGTLFKDSLLIKKSENIFSSIDRNDLLKVLKSEITNNIF